MNECTYELRTGFCVLSQGHRGRHTTVGFGCDGCGLIRRGRPAQHWSGGQFCFVCAQKVRRQTAATYRRTIANLEAFRRSIVELENAVVTISYE